MPETRVVTANVPLRMMRASEHRDALDAILAQRPTYAGLQEWGEDKLLAAAKERGYGYARGEGGAPVLFDLDRTGLLHVGAHRIARREFVGHLAARKSRLPASVLTEAVFEDDELGEVALLDGHFTAEVQSGGRYRRDAAHRLRVHRHKRERRRTARRARWHARKGRVVFVTVDGNFDGLTLRGVASCWSGRKSTGTLGRRTVDIVFANRAANAVRTFATGSDHRAVVVTYRES